MDFHDQIAPFNWIEHDDGTASVTLYASEKYKKKLFKTRKKEGFRGSGYDWESLAQVFICEVVPDMQQEIKFDSESGMFCAYASDFDALKRFIRVFKETCEDDKAIRDIFSRAEPEKPITKENMKKAMEEIMRMMNQPHSEK